MAFTPKQLQIFDILFKKDVDADIKIAQDFLKKLGFNKSKAFELAYMYTQNFQEDGNFKNVEDPETLSYSDYWGNIANEIKAIMFITDDEDPDNYELTSRKQYEEVTHITTGAEYMVFDDWDKAKSIAIDIAEELIRDGGIHNNYITMTNSDRRTIAGEEANNWYDEMDDDDIIREGDIEDEIEALNRLEEEANEIGSQIDDVYIKIEHATTQRSKTIYNNKLLLLYEKLKPYGYPGNLDFDKKRDDLIEKTMEQLKDEKSDEIYIELNDPIQYFVKDHGMYSLEDLKKANFIYIDYEQAAKDDVNYEGVGRYLSNYDGEENTVDIDGQTYYIYRTN